MRFCLGYRSRSSWRKSDGLIHLTAILLAIPVSRKKLSKKFLGAGLFLVFVLGDRKSVV